MFRASFVSAAVRTTCSIIVVGLVSCAPAFAADKAPPDPAVLAPTHGYVYVEYPKGGWDSLSARPMDGGKPVAIDMQLDVPRFADAKAFGKWLPSGKYQLGSWDPLQKWTDGPVFEVQAGRVTDLGGFVPVNIGGYQVVLVPVRHSEDRDDLALATKGFQDVLSDPEPIEASPSSVSTPITIGEASSGLGLIVDLLVAHDRKVNKPSTLEQLKATKDPAEFLRIERSVVPPLQDEPAVAADGALYFPANLGQLRRRSADGEWANVGIDTLRQVLAVEYDDGRLLAGSDDGLVRASDDGGATWTLLKSFGPREQVLDIDHAEGHWIVATLERYDDKTSPQGFWVAAPLGTLAARVRIYAGHARDLSDLAVSGEFTSPPKEQAGWLGARGQLVGGRYYIVVPPQVQRLDVSTGTWKQISPGPRTSSIRVDPQTGMMAALWSQGGFSKVYVSTDQGDSWTRIGRPPYVIYDVQMDAPDRGWASRWNMGAFGGDWETYRFAPEKNDWVVTGKAPFNCQPMRIPEGPVFCVATDASIFGLHEGKWEVEFSAH